MFKSKLFWGGVLLCSVVIFLGILAHRSSQTQEPIKIYKIVVPERRATSQTSSKEKEQTNEDTNETGNTSTPVDSDVPIDSREAILENTQLSETEAQNEESTPTTDIETDGGTESEEERFFGLTLAEIEERIPVLEEEIRTNLTKAVELYTELRSTDGMANKSPELIVWRDETWQEVKRLFHAVSDTGKIMNYTSYLKVTGVKENPLLPGGFMNSSNPYRCGLPSAKHLNKLT